MKLFHQFLPLIGKQQIHISTSFDLPTSQNGSQGRSSPAKQFVPVEEIKFWSADLNLFDS